MKKSLDLSKSIAIPNDKEINNANMPNQYARVKNIAKGENVIKDNTDQTYAFVDEFFEEAMKSSRLYETDEDVDYEYWSSNHNAHATLRISNSIHNKCMNLLHQSEKIPHQYFRCCCRYFCLRTWMESSFCSQYQKSKCSRI
jgi:DNA polymerase elongation subunit (family B)